MGAQLLEAGQKKGNGRLPAAVVSVQEALLLGRIVRFHSQQVRQNSAFLGAERALVTAGVKNRLTLLRRNRAEIPEGTLHQGLSIGRKLFPALGRVAHLRPLLRRQTLQRLGASQSAIALSFGHLVYLVQLANQALLSVLGKPVEVGVAAQHPLLVLNRNAAMLIEPCAKVPGRSIAGLGGLGENRVAWTRSALPRILWTGKVRRWILRTLPQHGWVLRRRAHATVFRRGRTVRLELLGLPLLAVLLAPGLLLPVIRILILPLVLILPLILTRLILLPAALLALRSVARLGVARLGIVRFRVTRLREGRLRLSIGPAVLAMRPGCRQTDNQGNG